MRQFVIFFEIQVDETGKKGGRRGQHYRFKCQGEVPKHVGSVWNYDNDDRWLNKQIYFLPSQHEYLQL